MIRTECLRLASMMRVESIVAIAAIAAIASASPAQAQAFADVKNALTDYANAQVLPRKTCDAMTRYRGKEVVEIHAAMIAGDNAVPAHCRVTGTLSPEIAFEVSLPARWNGRFYMIGNGGHAGESLEDPRRVAQRNGALQLGFAFAQTNTGHDALKEPGASFVLSNPQKALDYAYRAVHLTATTAKDITAQYYAKPISHAYWNSCSNGGRQGLLEAQRFPQDFDGLVVNAPWVDQTGFTIGAMWNQKALSVAPLTSAKLALLADKVMDRCDALDGLKDGLIDDPRKCDFDARRDVPSCRSGVDGPECLTAAQADAVMKIYGGPQAEGKTLFPGYMPGSEAVVPVGFGSPTPASAWMNVIVAAQPDGKPADFNLAENTMRYLVHTPPRPDYDYRDVRLRAGCAAARCLGQQSQRQEHGSVEVPEPGRQVVDDLRLGGPDPSAPDGRQLLRAGGETERSANYGLPSPIHGAGDDPLRWRHRDRPLRSDDGTHRLGGEAQGAGLDSGIARGG